MRAGVAISTAIHAGLFALLIFGLPQAEPYEVEETQAFDVEIVPFAPIPTTRLGSQEADVQEIASVIETDTQEVEEGLFQGNAERDLNEAPTDNPTNLDVEEQLSAPEVADPGPTEEPAPAEATPPQETVEQPPEPTSDPDTAPPPEADVAEEALPQEPETEEAEATPTPNVPVPTARPREIQVAAADFERRRAEQAEREAETNRDATSQAVNRQEVSGGGTQSSNQQASLGAQTGRANIPLTQSEEDNLRRQIEPCWSPPVGIADGESLRVSMRFGLNQDGTVSQNPQVVNSGNRVSFAGNAAAFRAAASAAQRAILRCAPYQMPPEKYEAWKDVIVNFDPRDLF